MAQKNNNPVYLIFADGSEEFERSLRYATLTAKKNKADIAVLKVIGDTVFQPWAGVEERIKEEQMVEAKVLLEEIVQKIQAIANVKCQTHILEGDKPQAVLELVKHDPNIKKLIVTSSTKRTSNGPVLTYFTNKGAHSLPITMTIVPGYLSDEEIDALV